MATSNTWDCYRECIGKRVVACLRSHNQGEEYRWLIFDDGTALVHCSTGAYWTESKDGVAREIKQRRDELTAACADLHEAAVADGVMSEIPS